MAVQLLGRGLPKLLQRPAALSCIRNKSFVANPDELIKDPAEHTTGLERQELLLRLAGNENPYYGAGGFHPRKDGMNEVPIPSTAGKRLVACMCEEDSQSVSWLWLYRGEPRRCKCGYWFKLVDARPI